MQSSHNQSFFEVVPGKSNISDIKVSYEEGDSERRWQIGTVSVRLERSLPLKSSVTASGGMMPFNKLQSVLDL
jgi:hypothetical protein